MSFGRVPRTSPGKPLHLRAEEESDLLTLAACLQDAVIKRADMGYQRSARRFAFLANRYRWECDGDYRIRCGLHIDTVRQVHQQGFAALASDATLSLLTISGQAQADGEHQIDLIFAGGPLIRLQVECIDVSLDDLGESWLTPRHPDHESEDPHG